MEKGLHCTGTRTTGDMRSLSRRLGSCKTVLILSLLGLLAVYEYPLIKSWYGGQQTGSPVNKDAPTSHKPKHEIEKPQRPPIQKNEKTLYEIRVVRKDGSEKHINWRDESNEKPEEAVESHIEPQPDEVELAAVQEILPVMEPQRLTCQLYNLHKVNLIQKSHFSSTNMTIKMCQKHCLKSTAVFMALTNGTSCICLDQHGTEIMMKDSACNVNCGGEPSVTCGGTFEMEVYRIDINDGNVGWTPWMRYAGKDGKVISSRYRDCQRDLKFGTLCQAKIERQIAEESEESYIDSVIGCFTSASFDKEEQLPAASIIESQQTTEDAGECLDYCSDSMYAVFVDETKCVCTKSLGWSQPTDSCKIGFGALVMSGDVIKDTVYLKFEARRTEKQVAVVAHYRGGSTIASAMFSIVPGSLSIYEPGRLFGRKWPDVAIQGQEEERSRIFMKNVYPAWFSCDTLSLPGAFYDTFPGPHQFDIGFDKYKKCKWKMQSNFVIETCAPYLKEKCLMAPVVSSKTVKILNGPAIKSAIQENPDINFVHAFRDPRAMHASRARMIKWYAEEPVERIKDTCWELSQLHDVFQNKEKFPNSQYISYEDIAADAIAAASKLYKSLNMNMTSVVSAEISKLSGDKAVRKSAFDIVQKDPKSRIYSWVQNHKAHSYISAADSTPECKDMFTKYREYNYKPLEELLPELDAAGKS